MPAIHGRSQNYDAGGRWVPEHGPAGRRAAARVTALQSFHARRSGEGPLPGPRVPSLSARQPLSKCSNSWHGMQHGGVLARHRRGNNLRLLQAQETVIEPPRADRWLWPAQVQPEQAMHHLATSG